MLQELRCVNTISNYLLVLVVWSVARAEWRGETGDAVRPYSFSSARILMMLIINEQLRRVAGSKDAPEVQ